MHKEQVLSFFSRISGLLGLFNELTECNLQTGKHAGHCILSLVPALPINSASECVFKMICKSEMQMGEIIGDNIKKIPSVCLTGG